MRFFKTVFLDLISEFRWSYLPPLMVYTAAGVAGLTGIVGTFFIKEYLNLSATFLAALSFWIGIPWALKMPVGHLVDLIWKRKNLLVFFGAFLITISLLIMFGLVAHTKAMAEYLNIETWFIISALLSPIGYMIQDVVADAMTVEAVPSVDQFGKKLPEPEVKKMHTTMQMLGRFAIIGGTIIVAIINVIVFKDIKNLKEIEIIDLYSKVYLSALIIPLISVLGVLLASKLKVNFSNDNQSTKPNWWILIGSFIFVIFTLFVGLMKFKFSEEIVFIGSMIIVIFLMKKLLEQLKIGARRMVIGTAIIIFVFRAMPNPGPGITWFEIDILGFDQQFISLLTLISSVLTIVGIIFLRPFMFNNSIAKIIVLLTVIGSVLFLPTVGFYYGFHLWTASITGGVVDARFIAVINTALESPLGQVAMIPLLAWIAKNSPDHLKATYFAVFASFTNLALSASALGTKYLNQIFTVTREVKDKITNKIVSTQDYSELGFILLSVLFISFLVPLITVSIIQKSKIKTFE